VEAPFKQLCSIKDYEKKKKMKTTMNHALDSAKGKSHSRGRRDR
jgi:hypothetical protein